MTKKSSGLVDEATETSCITFKALTLSLYFLFESLQVIQVLKKTPGPQRHLRNNPSSFSTLQLVHTLFSNMIRFSAIDSIDNNRRAFPFKPFTDRPLTPFGLRLLLGLLNKISIRRTRSSGSGRRRQQQHIINIIIIKTQSVKGSGGALAFSIRIIGDTSSGDDLPKPRTKMHSGCVHTVVRPSLPVPLPTSITSLEDPPPLNEILILLCSLTLRTSDIKYSIMECYSFGH